MEVHFTPEQESKLFEIASQAGTEAEQLVKNAALRLLESDARFRASVRKGMEQADRGDFVDEREMESRFDRMLQS
jgi:predicted transcriptional regulator